MDMYAEYTKERENMDLVALENGFATYRKIDDSAYYLVDIFVKKEHRRKGIASQLSEIVKQIAIKDGAIKLFGSVDLTKNGVTESIASIIADGFRFSHAEGNGLYFVKKIGD